MGALCRAIFNFSPSARPLNIAIPRFPSLTTAMSKPAYLEYAPTKPVNLFVPSRKQRRRPAPYPLRFGIRTRH
ncbi:hypothetical protein ARMSODRAFT_887194 [Armillaria solidipes]|uniref:Uncharacterized protein n=1 Tax=Armillaria solidipes TaxID=1076256 RepID=A0A2H3BGJ9_9AGAR|nr:hypothetical protein ARMSODRAFT_887194 [Armillaria solidipes]